MSGPPLEVLERAAALRAEILEHDHRYYVLDAPIIDDRSYDALYRELVDLERAHPGLRTPDSPTQRVGGEPIEGLDAFPHEVPMLSLGNTYSADEVRDFDQQLRRYLGLGEGDPPIAYTVEPKLDGVALELVYEGGELVGAGTRGDGRVGEEVTANARTIRSVPLALSAAGPLASLERFIVRGEVVIPLAGFNRMNRERERQGLDPYVNPRNTAAGTLRQLDPRVAAQRPLLFLAHSPADAGALPLDRHSAFLEALGPLGLKVAEGWSRVTGVDAVLEQLEAVGAGRDARPYEIDGAVVKVDDFSLQGRLGMRSKAPRWAMAYKYPAVPGTTRVLGITVQVGRTGAVTPVAELDPVFVGGVEIRRATLHNQDELDRKDVRVGDTVMVRRAGEVIPEVLGVLIDARPDGTERFVLPQHCPVCGAPTEREGAVLRCSNQLGCPAQQRQAILHFVSRAAADIEGLGEKMVDQLLEHGLIGHPADLFHLAAEDLTGLERSGELTAKRILDGVERARHLPWDRLLFGLGIRHVGSSTARLLAVHFGSLERLMAAGLEELLDVDEVGPAVAGSVLAFFGSEAVRGQVERLRSGGVRFADVERSDPGGAVAGKTVVLTGNLESMTTGGLNEHGLSIAIEFLPMRSGLACDKGVVGPNSNH
ncbi:MAG: NAD-dependent DNA ligase LigA, partial [Deltaproteobacteria bacterium]|nr:NAD-dependent DNA ligase LigA [Deltaproteobacteria bacterium]MBW2530811.1 NAD-dependent DNA ligase LigA [Deltaproteobacteria bacterium]